VENDRHYPHSCPRSKISANEVKAQTTDMNALHIAEWLDCFRQRRLQRSLNILARRESSEADERNHLSLE
jgi:hypothetical protein